MLDMKPLRLATVDYVKKFDKEAWFADPVRTILKGNDFQFNLTLEGVSLSGGETTTTVNAFHATNGKLVLATQEEVDNVITHLQSYVPPKKALFSQIRAVEDEILSVENAAFLVGNQCLDFGKQVVTKQSNTKKLRMALQKLRRLCKPT